MRRVLICLSLFITPSAPLKAQGPHASEIAEPRLVGAVCDSTEAFGSLAAGRTGSTSDYQIQSVVDVCLLWPQSSSVTIAFLGGDVQLHREIADVAEQWSQHGNLTLDFGYDASTHSYRSWDLDEQAHSADIRIQFDGKDGYWSHIGRESSGENLLGQASMNLQYFHLPDARPTGWREIALHEFGHALGFHHEHQSPAEGCDGEFRWEDESGYQVTLDRYGEYVRDENERAPGLYLRMSGPPNAWNRWMIDFSLRQFRDSRLVGNLWVSAFDDRSIMLYRFEPWMFVKGEKSPCFHRAPCEDGTCGLSDGDKRAYAAVYPKLDARERTMSTLQTEAYELLSHPATSAELESWVDRLKETIEPNYP